jgi:hypothetical protein
MNTNDALQKLFEGVIPVRKQYVHYTEDWRWSSASKVPIRIAVTNIENEINIGFNLQD